MAKNDLQGALDLLILKTLAQLDSMHVVHLVRPKRGTGNDDWMCLSALPAVSQITSAEII